MQIVLKLCKSKNCFFHPIASSSVRKSICKSFPVSKWWLFGIFAKYLFFTHNFRQTSSGHFVNLLKKDPTYLVIRVILKSVKRWICERGICVFLQLNDLSWCNWQSGMWNVRFVFFAIKWDILMQMWQSLCNHWSDILTMVAKKQFDDGS